MRLKFYSCAQHPKKVKGRFIYLLPLCRNIYFFVQFTTYRVNIQTTQVIIFIMNKNWTMLY